MSQSVQFAKKIGIIAIVLCAYRFGAYVSLPFIDVKRIAEFGSFAKSSGMLSMLKTFSGGALTRASIFGMGLMPAITASIVVQLVMASFPSLKQVRMDGGPDVQYKITLATRCLTLAVALLQSFAIAETFVSAGLYNGTMPVFTFKVLCAIFMMMGTSILVWLGDIITARGFGNGQSLIIFGSIVSEVPADTAKVFDFARGGVITGVQLLVLAAIFVATVALIVFIERAHRLIFVQYPRQAHSFVDRNSIPKENYMPLKVNTAGIVPPIFASAMLALPAMLAQTISGSGNAFTKFVSTYLGHGQPLFMCIYGVLIVAFGFFYNSVLFDANDIADNLKRGNVFIPGCRPGSATAELIQDIVHRLAFYGGAYLLVICLLPEYLANTYDRVIFLGGTSLLIAISVVIDTIASAKASLMSTKYTKVMKRYDRR